MRESFAGELEFDKAEVVGLIWPLRSRHSSAHRDWIGVKEERRQIQDMSSELSERAITSDPSPTLLDFSRHVESLMHADELEGPKSGLVHSALRRRVDRHPWEFAINHNMAARSRCKRGEAFCLCRSFRQGFLAENVATGLKAASCDLEMCVRRSGDYKDVRACFAQHLVERGELGDALRHAYGALVIASHQGRPLEFSNGWDVDGARRVSQSDYGEPQSQPLIAAPGRGAISTSYSEDFEGVAVGW